ncbi:hypothetical protein B5M09_010004 [Aphanomyces astaci]|uniref:Cyclic nucleotide-binding domain-containing protein n=1 Tax=Aphanomyces astaci TaxID=112090 RepID=A0A425C7Z0_APHAT|nr:hypothetical protein B5M09_010004 [Aphanomyces astaci]
MNAVHPVLPPIGGDKGSRGGGGGMLPPIGGDKGSRGGSGGGLNGDRRVSAGGSSGSFPTTARERRMSTIQVVKMGKSTRNMMNKPVVMLPDAAAMSADITEELRNTAPNMGRDVIAISTTATPVQVSMSPQEEMMNHAHLEKALKNKGDNTIRGRRFVVDFSSTFPFTQVLAAQDEQLGKILRLFRLVRLLRLFRMIRILNRLQHALLIRSTISSLFRYCLTVDEINEYMAARDLPRQLRIEIREFFQNARKSKENDMLQEQELLNELSAMLRSKIALAINDHFLWKFPFFKGSDPNFIMDLALSMRMICFAPFEDVCVEGELGHEMFFIFRGAVEVLKDGIQLTVLGENQYFGEMAILNKDCKRMATVRTLCFCELRMLSRVRFLEALVHFPKMMQKLANYSKARAQAKNNLGTPQSTQRDSTDDDTRVVGRKNSKPKNPSYRLNWKSSIEPDHEGLSGFGMHSGGIGAEAVLQLDRIKRVQEVLTGKVRDLHSMMDSMLSTQAADESPPRSEQTT